MPQPIFNGDGKLDLVVGSSSSSTGWLLFGNGDGTFGSAVPFNAGSSIDSQIAVADINNDGHPDVVFTNSALGTVTVLFGNGEGSFSPPVVFPAGVSPASVAVGDFNGDGIPDLVVTNTTSNQVSVLLGQQVASYSATGISLSGSGTHNVLISYSGDGSRLPSQSPTVPLAGIMATPTVNVFCSPNPITYGSTSTCTTAVSGGATGTVAWTINGAAWTTTSISGGAATVSGFSGSSVGSYTIGAAYSGDSGNNAGSSSTVLTIQPVTRTVGVSCSPNPTTYGNSSTTCTATASAGAGSMVFTYNGGTSWITVPISGGTASAVGFGGFGAGTYSVVATAHGDSNYADGASGTTNYVINPATPTVSVSCLANPITYGSETSSCTTSVTAGATGTIAWTINGGAWTTTPVTSPAAGGFAGYAAGPYTIGVTYSGDSNYTSGSSSTVLTIQKAVRTVLVSCSPDPTTWPATHTTCTATVSAGGGSVNFTYNGGTPWGTVGIGGGTASIAGFDGVAAGTYPVVATASGDPNYVDGASSSTNYFVNKATPTVGVSCAPNPITYGPQTTTCTIAVGGGATGAVAVTYNGTAWASPVLSSGSASVSGMNSQPAGSYSIVANYPGDANNNAAANSTTLTILQVATSMTGVIVPNPITFGQSFTVSGHVNCNSACGNLQYFIDGSPWGINSLDGAGNYAAGYGTATTGVHMIQVNYLGDANHSPSSWGPAPVTVLPIATSVTVSCSPNPLTYGTSASCTAHVSGGRGTVTFTGTSSEPGPWTEPVDGSGNAVLSGFSDWPIGTYTISVASSGDANYSGAANSTAFTVIPAGPSVLMWAAGNQFESTASLSLSPATAGNANGVTAQMFGGNSPTGTVAFMNGGTNYGTPPIQSVSATNLFRQSVDMTNGSVWGPAGEALTPNAGLAPDGTSSATQVVSIGTDPMTWQGVTTGGVANQTFTASIWVKATGSAISKLGRIWMFPSDGSIPGCSVPETAAWTRVSCTISFGPSLGPSLTVRYDMTDAGAASGDTVLVWGPQLEASSMPGPYVPTKSAAATASQPVATAGSYVTSPGTYAVTAAYGGDGTNTAASSSMGLTAIAASPLSVMTVNPTTTPYGSPVSMSALISTGGDAPTGALNFASDGGEVASASPAPATTTNYIPFSRNFSMWTWEATNPTSVEPGTIPGPNGLPGDVATVVFPSTTGTYSGIRYTDSTTNLVGKTMTFSFWARADAPSSLSFDLADWPWSGNFAAGNGCGVTTTWQRCSVSGTFPANANGGFYVPIRSDNQASPITVYLWGPQLEEGAAGPYVSTAGSARTAFGGIATGSISTLPVGTHAMTAIIAADSNLNAATSAPVTVIITAVSPTGMIVSCAPNPITYGPQTTTCTASGLPSDATGTVAFSFNGTNWANPPIAGGSASASGFNGMPAGSYSIVAGYSGDGNYTSASASTTLTISKATPIITWATPAAITYPTLFGPAQETATANVPGTFKYSPKAGDLEDAGPNKGLAVTFTPTDTTDYNTATATVYITINKGTPTATWAPPPLTYGQGLTAAQLNAMASVPGTFTYFDALGTIFTAGTHTLNATFHPTNGPDYNELTSVTAILTVNMATPTITWPTPAAITYGTPLSATQLDATADIQGDFAYAPPAGTILLAGSQTLSITFTPTIHTADYTTATASVLLLVNKATPTVSVSCSPNPITYGPQNTSCTATVSGSPTGSLTWTINGGAWTTTPVAAPTAGGFSGYPAGSYTIAVAYSGDSNNIGSSSSTVLAILPAMTTTTIPSSLNPSVLGQNVSWPCSVTSPDGTPTGMITYTLDGNPLGTISTTDAPWSGAGLTVGAHILTCSFAAQGNFAASSGTVTQTVGSAPTVTELLSSANPIVFGGSATFTALVDTGGSVAPTASVAFTSNGVAIGSAAVSTVTTTNLLNNSDVSTWAASGPTLTANASAAPDGTLTATHVVFPANSGCCINIGMTSSSAWVPGSTYTYSLWLRSDSNAAVQVSLRTGPGGESDTMPTMTPTWTRYTISGTVPVGATGNVTALMYLADTPGVDYYAWGAQVEQAATVGPYIATSGAPATGSGGIATLTTTTLPPGNDTIVATYGGDAGTGTSTSNRLIEVVTEASPTITWNNPAPIVYGTPLSGTQLNATASVPGTFTYSPVAGTVLSAGSQTLSVTFAPTDSADYSTQTATVTLVVNKATLTITPNPASKVYGAANPAFTGTVTGLIPGDAISVGYTSAATTTIVVGVYSSGPNAISSTTSGPVNILGNYNYIQPLGTLTITQATTTLTWATPTPITYGTPLGGTQLNATSGGVDGTFVYTPAAGVVLSAESHTLTVTFTPTDTVDYSSATATVALTVNQATPTVTLTSSLSPANYGTPVTFTAQTAAFATGSMTFYDGATIIGTGTISGGIATYTTTTLATGSHSVTASYGGDSNYSPAGSDVLTEVITRTAATVTLTSTVNPSAYGETTTFTFTATGVAGLGTPSGTVVISDGATWLATPPLDASGVARFTTAALLVGSHTLTAVYGGDVNYK